MSLQLSCELSGISRQAFYKRQKALLKHKDQMDQVADLVRSERREMPRLGTRKLYFLLRQNFLKGGLKVGRDKLFSYLRHMNMLVRPVKSYTKTTNSRHWMHKHPNLVKGFKACAPEQLWVSDITYIPMQSKTSYLSLITDAYSRKIMGFHVSEDLRTENMVSALKMAIRNKRTNNTIIHHSDRGLQYCSDAYQKVLDSNNLICSMTDGYDCYQNALAERMNGILKMEFLYYKYPDLQTLRRSVEQSVHIYNNKRPHLALELLTPEKVHKKSPAVH